MEERISQLIKYLSSFLLVSYVYGFIIWNYTLSKFGFFEYNFLQTRYVSAGILYLLICSPILLLIFLSRKHRRFSQNNPKVKKLIIFLIVLLFVVVFYSRYIFPYIPQYLGGGRPIPITLIGTGEQIDFLTNFNVPNIDDEKKETPFQTSTLCSIYQNQDLIILGAIDENKRARVLTIERSLFSGISVIRPSETKDASKTCAAFVSGY